MEVHFFVLWKKKSEIDSLRLIRHVHKVIKNPGSSCLFPVPFLACGFHSQGHRMVTGYPVITPKFMAKGRKKKGREHKGTPLIF